MSTPTARQIQTITALFEEKLQVPIGASTLGDISKDISKNVTPIRELDCNNKWPLWNSPLNEAKFTIFKDTVLNHTQDNVHKEALVHNGYHPLKSLFRK